MGLSPEEDEMSEPTILITRLETSDGYPGAAGETTALPLSAVRRVTYRAVEPDQPTYPTAVEVVNAGTEMEPRGATERRREGGGGPERVPTAGERGRGGAMKATIWHPRELATRHHRGRAERSEVEMARRRCAIRRQLHRAGIPHERLRNLDLAGLRLLRQEVSK